jgi:hypothetical protein
MSKIALTPSATGTGVFTISSPATNTNRTLTLPDEAGTVLTSASSLASANLTGSVPSSAMPAGSVIQVVQAATSTQVLSGTSTGTYFDVGLSANITPQFTTSKILVIVSLRLFAQPNTTCIVRTLRDAVFIHGISRYGLTDTSTVGNGDYYVASVLDAPNTNSVLTYKTEVGRGAGSNSWYAQLDGNPSTITLMEIAA